jgi:hypothetical protein
MNSARDNELHERPAPRAPPRLLAAPMPGGIKAPRRLTDRRVQSFGSSPHVALRRRRGIRRRGDAAPGPALGFVSCPPAAALSCAGVLFFGRRVLADLLSAGAAGVLVFWLIPHPAHVAGQAPGA